jgi:hypothetical protein
LSQADVFQGVRRRLGEAGLEVLEAKSPEALRLRLEGRPFGFRAAWQVAMDTERGIADSLPSSKAKEKAPAPRGDPRVDVEVVVRLQKIGNDVDLEWDIRPDPKMRRRLRADSTWRALLALGALAVPAALAGTTIDLSAPNQWGLLVMLLTFLMIPPLTIYTMLEFARAAYIAEGTLRQEKTLGEVFAKGFPGVAKVKRMD